MTEHELRMKREQKPKDYVELARDKEEGFYYSLRTRFAQV